jgi:hypothetical protein
MSSWNRVAEYKIPAQGNALGRGKKCRLLLKTQSTQGVARCAGSPCAEDSQPFGLKIVKQSQGLSIASSLRYEQLDQGTLG